MERPVHPGIVIRDDVVPVLRANGITVTAFAELLGMGRENLYQVMGGRQPLTPAAAARLGRLFGDARLWLGAQAAYDLALAEEQLEADQIALPDLRALPIAA